MTSQVAQSSQETQMREPAPEAGRRIRWERDTEDRDRIIVLDAVTGKVIAIVRSLFEMALK
ncbi:MAG: hypothetical protein KA764_00265 [Anaerolineales bacterium]|nr:hypothetical protein [Anaerolineales bacterium]